MKHLLLVLVLWIARLVAGLPRLYYIDKDSASILQKSNLQPAVLTEDPKRFTRKLVPRAGPKGGAAKGSAAGNGPKLVSTNNLPSSGQAAKVQLTSDPKKQQETDTTRKRAKGNAQLDQQPISQGVASQRAKPNSWVLAKQDTNRKQHETAVPQSKSRQNPKIASTSAGGKKHEGSLQAKSKSASTGPLSDGPKTRSKSKASTSDIPAKHSTKQGKSGGATGGKNAAAGSSSRQKLAKGSSRQSIAGGVTKTSRKSAFKQQSSTNMRSHKGALRNERMTRSKTASVAQNTRSKSLRGGESMPDAKGGSTKGKNLQLSSKRTGGELAGKSSRGTPSKKRICRRADNEITCEPWDVEQGLPRPNPDEQSSRTSSAPLVPPMITSMSRTGKEYAKANPWTTGTYVLSAGSAALGNAAGVTDHCCNEDCAKSASHVLNYCGMTAGIAGAAVAFTGATIAYNNRKKEREEQNKAVETLKMKTEGHDAAIEDHRQKIEQTDKKFSTELTRTKQTLSQVTKRLGVPKPPEEVV